MTMLHLDDELAHRAKLEAEKRGTSLDAFVHQILQQHIACATKASASAHIVLPTHDLGGATNGINFDDGRALRKILDSDGFARC